jgi:hypothetical protein
MTRLRSLDIRFRRVQIAVKKCVNSKCAANQGYGESMIKNVSPPLIVPADAGFRQGLTKTEKRLKHAMNDGLAILDSNEKEAVARRFSSCGARRGTSGNGRIR